MAIQSLWQSVPAQIQAPNLNSSAALAINAWDQISKGLSGLGETLIENPTSKMYLNDLNQGKDVSGYNPLTLSRKVLEDTPATQNQLLQNKNQVLQNDAKALENAIANAREAQMNDPQLRRVQALAAAGKTNEAATLLNEIAKAGNLRADIQKEYLPNIFDQQMDRDQHALAWARFNQGKLADDLILQDRALAEKSLPWIKALNTQGNRIGILKELLDEENPELYKDFNTFKSWVSARFPDGVARNPALVQSLYNNIKPNINTLKESRNAYEKLAVLNSKYGNDALNYSIDQRAQGTGESPRDSFTNVLGGFYKQQDLTNQGSK